MLIAMIDGSFASSPITLSAGGQDEQPCEVKSSTTARGSAWAGRMTAMMAQMPSVLDQREIRLWAIVVVITLPPYFYGLNLPQKCKEAALVLGRLQIRRHSLRGEQIGFHSLRSEPAIAAHTTLRVCAARTAECRHYGSSRARPAYRCGRAAARAADCRRRKRSRR